MLTYRVVEIVTKSVYVLTGAFYLSLGVAVLLVGTGILPVWIHDKIFELGQNNPFTMHLIQETGTLWVLVGILFIWFARHYKREVPLGGDVLSCARRLGALVQRLWQIRERTPGRLQCNPLRGVSDAGRAAMSRPQITSAPIENG